MRSPAAYDPETWQLLRSAPAGSTHYLTIQPKLKTPTTITT